MKNRVEWGTEPIRMAEFEGSPFQLIEFRFSVRKPISGDFLRPKIKPARWQMHRALDAERPGVPGKVWPSDLVRSNQSSYRRVHLGRFFIVGTTASAMYLVWENWAFDPLPLPYL